MENEFSVHFKKDGNTWSAFIDEGGNNARALAGVGETPEEALKDLFLEKDKDEYQKEVRDK